MNCILKIAMWTCYSASFMHLNQHRIDVYPILIITLTSLYYKKMIRYRVFCCQIRENKRAVRRLIWGESLASYWAAIHTVSFISHRQPFLKCVLNKLVNFYNKDKLTNYTRKYTFLYTSLDFCMSKQFVQKSFDLIHLKNNAYFEELQIKYMHKTCITIKV